MKAQEFLQKWEKENNPFYPNEMKWDIFQVNLFAKAFDDANRNEITLPAKVKLKHDMIYGHMKNSFILPAGEIGEYNEYTGCYCFEQRNGIIPYYDKEIVLGSKEIFEAL